MPLTTIFVIRHGFRSNWTTDPVSGETTSNVKSPTGIASDPALSAYGVTQAGELAKQAEVLRPKVCRVYSSPFYRCIQTVEPLWKRLQTVPLICDRGIGEWYGTARFTHPSAAELSLLQTMFPALEENTTITPSSNGETIEELHDRCAFALDSIISDVDKASSSTEKQSIVICSHAATIIAIGRALTGNMPEDTCTKDFDTYTCSISRFERSTNKSCGIPAKKMEGHPPKLPWRGGRGVGGGWRCEVNAEIAHLSNGGERNWHFSGDESFVYDTANVAGHTVQSMPSPEKSTKL